MVLGELTKVSPREPSDDRFDGRELFDAQGSCRRHPIDSQDHADLDRGKRLNFRHGAVQNILTDIGSCRDSGLTDQRQLSVTACIIDNGREGQAACACSGDQAMEVIL